MESSGAKSVSLLSKLTAWWVFPILRLAKRKELTYKDIETSIPETFVQDISPDFARDWIVYKEKQISRKKQWHIVTFLWRRFRKEYSVAFLLQFLNIGLFQPLIIISFGALMRYFNCEPGYESKFYGWGFTLMLIMTLFLTLLVKENCIHTSMIVALKMTSALSVILYDKALKLKRLSKSASVSQISSLFMVDAARMPSPVMRLTSAILSPLSVIVITVFLCYEVGYAGLVGTILSIPCLLFYFYMSKWLIELRIDISQRIDQKVGVLIDFLQGIDSIKMYAWEKLFTEEIQENRRQEESFIRKKNHLLSTSKVFVLIFQPVVVFLVLLAHVMMGNTLNPEKVFVCTITVSFATYPLAKNLSMLVTLMADSFIFCKRIQEFLEVEEDDNPVTMRESQKLLLGNDSSIECDNICVAWSDNTPNALKNVSINAYPGDLIVVLGKGGSGKTTLLQALLKCMNIRSGTVSVAGKVSFAPQEPWIFEGTVMENILLTEPYNPVRYKEILRVCDLDRDINKLPEGDQTVIKPSNMELSIGQCARIGLARAVYRESDIYLFDDSLKAVDPHTGSHIHERCFEKFLKKKIRIFCTNQPRYIKNASNVIILRNGEIDYSGGAMTVNQNKRRLSYFSEEDVMHKQSFTVASFAPSEKMLQKRKGSVAWSSIQGARLSVIDLMITSDQVNDLLNRKESTVNDVPIIDNAIVPVKKNIRKEALKKFIHMGGGLKSIILLTVVNIVAELFLPTSQVLMTAWVKSESDHEISEDINIIQNDSSEDLSKTVYETKENWGDIYMYGYSGAILGWTIFAFIRCFTLLSFMLRGASKTHRKTTQNFENASSNFFRSNPLGDIVARFIYDYAAVDGIVSLTILYFICDMLIFAGNIVLNLIVSYMTVIPLVLLLLGASFLTRFYLEPSNSIKRLESRARGPLSQCSNYTLEGLQCIKIQQAETYFQEKFKHYLMKCLVADYTYRSATFWFSICLNCVTFLTSSIIILMMLALEELGGAFAGLIISVSINLAMIIAPLILNYVVISNMLVSVERITHHLDIDMEKDSEEIEEAPPQWPTEGAMSLENVFLKCDNSRPILKDITVNIKPRRMIGVVGRTGAGKSTILKCLLRLMSYDGMIQIDGKNIAKMPLRRLRKSFAVVPQQPLIFNGTIRCNLDPLSEHPDVDVWNALSDVQLLPLVSQLGQGLDSRLGNQEHYISPGQRQLLCLARAILRKSRIVLIDELSANIDPKTSLQMARILKTKFADSTVLTVSHNLDDVIEYNKIMVLEGGKLMEYDEPYLLLENEDSIFSRLVRENGPTKERQLKARAKISFMNRNSGPETDMYSPTEKVVGNKPSKSAKFHEDILEEDEDEESETESSRL